MRISSPTAYRNATPVQVTGPCPQAPFKAAPEAAPRYDARALIRDGATAAITLDDKTYTLRITRAGKLILTK